jgi:hypothetical protein
MRAIALGCALAGSVAVGTLAQAQDRPAYLPTRDVTVQYAVTADAPGVPSSVTVHITAGGQVRIDAGDRGTVLYDNGSSHASWILPQGRLAIDLPVPSTLAGNFIPNASTRFARQGSETVAGLRCTDWHVSVPKGSGTACVTPDGVILRGAGSDGKGHSGSIVATSVAYGTQPADLFALPPGTQRLSFPKHLSIAPPSSR